jgi:hypothetical protein
MKSLLLFVTLFFFFKVSFSQNVIGNVKRGFILIAELTSKEADSSNAYKLRFLDASSNILKSIEFNATTKELDDLYESLIKQLPEKNGTSSDLKIGDNKLNITTQKMMGLRNLLITINETFNFGLNGNELKRLFGKQ